MGYDEAPRVTVRDIRALIDDGRDNAVLHLDRNKAGEYCGLAVWVEPHAGGDVVITRQQCLDRVGTSDAASIDDQEIRDYLLDSVQDAVDQEWDQEQQ